MTAVADAKRGRVIARLGLAAALTAAFAVAIVNRDARARSTPNVAGALVPGLSEQFDALDRITVTTAETEFDVVRAGEAWTLPQRDGYPARPARVAEIFAAIAAFELVERKTADVERYAALDLRDPEQGGNAVRLAFYDAEDTRLATVFLGRAGLEGTVYVRRDDDPQTFAAMGERPNVDEVSDWIDLTFFAVPRETLARVRVQPETGPAYELAISPEDGAYSLTSPETGWTLRSARAHAVVSATNRMRFEDVRPAGGLPGPAVAEHEVRTREGLVARLSLFADGEARWVRIEPGAAPPEGADPGADPEPQVIAQAAAFAARSEGWLYRLPPFAPDRLVRPLSDIAEPAEG